MRRQMGRAGGIIEICSKMYLLSFHRIILEVLLVMSLLMGTRLCKALNWKIQTQASLSEQLNRVWNLAFLTEVTYYRDCKESVTTVVQTEPDGGAL